MKRKPLFKPGDTVYVAPLKRFCVISRKLKPQYNGFTFMYSFEGESLSCGEIYLTKSNENLSQAPEFLN